MTRPCLDDPDMALSVMFQTWPHTASVFLARRMACFGCLIAPFHTVMDACAEYGLDEDVFRAEIAAAAAAGAG